MEFKCNDILCNDALTLITEQEQEIEQLKTEIERLERVINDQNELCWSCKKSVKEFAEKLKQKARGLKFEDGKGGGFYFENVLLTSDIDELLKE